MTLENQRIEEKMMQDKFENRVTHLIIERTIKGFRNFSFEITYNYYLENIYYPVRFGDTVLSAAEFRSLLETRISDPIYEKICTGKGSFIW